MVKRSKNKVYLFLLDLSKLIQFKLKATKYLDNVYKIVRKIKELNKNANDRFDNLTKAYSDAKNAMMMKLL